MIPYWHWTTQPITLIEGVLEIHMFGLLVGIGILTGVWLAQRRAAEAGLNPMVIGDLGIFVVIVAFFFAHQVSLFFYFPERVFGPDGSWLEIFKIWSGISSFGGFLGAAIALALFFRFERIVLIPGLFELKGGKGLPAMKYMDALAYAFAAAWIFGRLGCFAAHDHIGKPTEFFLAVNFPDGFRRSVPAVAEFGAAGYTPRWDLGFMEVFWAVGIFAVYHVWARRRPDLRPGWYAAVMMISYAPYRLWLDTLRATDIGDADTRYLAELVPPGITPGQIGAVVVLILGIVTWRIGGRLAADPEYMSGDRFSGEGAREGNRAALRAKGDGKKGGGKKGSGKASKGR
ncbi:MAG: hypothetical protein EA398_18180 [Deltaproteobacteria bacterium]|nr:MAG: hypothetical protein EA398_18180 [Deltaproteobacteria bacterium]